MHHVSVCVFRIYSIIKRDFSSFDIMFLNGFDINPFVPTVAFLQLRSNICCPRDAVSRTANVEHNGGHKWVKSERSEGSFYLNVCGRNFWEFDPK